MARAWGVLPHQLLELDAHTYGLMVDQLAAEAEARNRQTK